VNPAVGTEPGETSQNGSPCQTVLARLLEKPFVQRHPLVPVRLADEDAQQVTLSWKYHGILTWSRSSTPSKRSRGSFRSSIPRSPKGWRRSNAWTCASIGLDPRSETGIFVGSRGPLGTTGTRERTENRASGRSRVRLPLFGSRSVLAQQYFECRMLQGWRVEVALNPIAAALDEVLPVTVLLDSLGDHF
jgi:hypothetical protein